MSTDIRPLAERITQTRMHAFRLSDYTIIGGAPPAAGAHIARMVTRPDMEPNAELITEAFNVTHETGLTPRELARDREELAKVLDELLAIYDMEQHRTRKVMPMDTPLAQKAIADARELLNRLTSTPKTTTP